MNTNMSSSGVGVRSHRNQQQQRVVDIDNIGTLKDSIATSDLSSPIPISIPVIDTVYTYVNGRYVHLYMCVYGAHCYSTSNILNH